MAITDLEKDLRVNIDSKLKLDKLHGIQENKANKLPGIISRSLMYHNERSIVTLYKSLILEYGHMISFPRYKKV